MAIVKPKDTWNNRIPSKHQLAEVFDRLTPAEKALILNGVAINAARERETAETSVRRHGLEAPSFDRYR